MPVRPQPAATRDPGGRASRCRCWRRYAWPLLAIAGLLGCSVGGDEPVGETAPPDVDRESWDVQLDLHRPGLSVHIRAPYVADYVQPQLTRMDSGVSVSLVRDGHVQGCRIQSHRFTLRHAQRLMCWAGGVRLDVADTLQLEADSLVWDGAAERLQVPGGLHLRTTSGWERGRGLVTDAGLEAWTMERISGEWHGSGPEGAYQLAVSARAESGRRVQGVDIVYDSVTVVQQDLRAWGPRARLRERRGILEFPGGIQVEAGRYQMQAEQARVDLGRARLEGEGQVVYQLREDDVHVPFTMGAQRAVLARRESLLVAVGSPVSFTQQGRQLRADSLTYRSGQEQVELIGGVSFADSVVRLDADSLWYARGADRVRAGGSVRVVGRRMDGVLHARQLVYHPGTARGSLTGAPSLRRSGADGSTAVLTAGVMELDLAARTLDARQGVRVRTAAVEIHAGRARYGEDEGEILLLDDAEFSQRQQEGKWRCQVRADTMRARWVEGRITGVVLPGMLRGTIQFGGQRTSWIGGRDGVLYLEDGKVVRLDLGADADVTSRDPERNRVTRFTGAEMVMEFAASGLRRTWVGGGAEVVWRVLEPEAGEEAAVNRVAGEEVEIRFAHGHMEVRVGPGVDGEYRPEQRN